MFIDYQYINHLWHIFNINALVISHLQSNFSEMDLLPENQSVANYQHLMTKIDPQKQAKNDDILMSKY